MILENNKYFSFIMHFILLFLEIQLQYPAFNIHRFLLIELEHSI